ncbi:TetR/AcrR family transcriptional regulator [Psychromonas antarctica]|jgi:AcrR family transcriptional regulator|uniref:TetR/AcrR family transcriptional regulator n=1 Tax=Psychromonas antarctica TaxID=67573 RepID=UPI001EE99412|nr:TetR family transcriptional regulator [Psychromonas antarctica]MCG6200656.1 TetR family transcriptional regulator [Psychromonas antarctica]
MTIDKIKREAGRPKIKVDNRAKLITAALLLFVSDDYDKVSVRAIASQADLDPGLIRYYFQSKLGLFTAMINETVEPVTKQLSAIDQKLNASTAEQLMQIYYQVMSQNPHLPKLIFRILSMKESDVNQQLKVVLENIFKAQNLTLFSRLKETGFLQAGVDPVCAQLSFFSMMIFPFLMPELLKSALGISITPAFMLQMGKQNSQLLCHGMIATQTNSKDDNNDHQ